LTELHVKGRKTQLASFFPSFRHTGKIIDMKNTVLTILLFSIVGALAAQSKPVKRDLVTARGHYKQLMTFSPKPKSPNENIDKQKFITDRETVERRMSRKPNYLINVSVNDFRIPDVPANSSEQTKAEIQYLLTLQKRRTEEDVRASLFYADVYYNLSVKPTDPTYPTFRRNLFHIGRSIGSWFNPDDMPVTADFMARVWQDASYFIWSLKFKYARIRPVVIDQRIKNLQETDWAAYPSGHASNSYINAYIYRELAPEFTDVFTKDAYDMAHSREIIGVHYPSDSESARMFARQFVNMLFANGKFLADFEKVKEEWAVRAKETFR
jgi:acid phosphatase (class A)